MPNITQTFRASLDHPVNVAWDWHARPGAFARLAPPWEQMELLESSGGLDVGARTVFRVRKAGVPITWVAEHTAHQVYRFFVDEQREGPFASWRHEHRFSPVGEDRCELEDEVQWSPPLGPLGAVAVPALKRTNDALFRFRQQRLISDLDRHAPYRDQPSKTIAITGVTGLVGSALKAFLSTGGHRVIDVVRRNAKPGDCLWDPAAGTIDAAALDGVDAVVHLAGAPVSSTWTASHKQAIRESRVQGTTLLANTLAGLSPKPAVLVSASAIGIYGDSGDPIVTEKSELGTDFLAEVCKAWEASADAARDAGIRVVHPRIGIVTSAAGGALAAMLPAFRAGGGGPIAGGQQWISWIALDDLIGMLHAAIMDDRWRGPVNAVAPNPLRQSEQARALARVLSRPALIPVPAAAIRTLFGEMGENLILAGQRVQPSAALNLGFKWHHPDYSRALRFTLGVA
ncbi:MAG: TIGR01777 family oxidoreductase [Myxococcota bacterium]